jgi:hypothetical protein
MPRGFDRPVQRSEVIRERRRQLDDLAPVAAAHQIQPDLAARRDVFIPRQEDNPALADQPLILVT